ncbi:ribosomal protein S18-alanine N-acetyltransferase [Acetobacter suratthaniensis]|uniref:[Ribosomal protein bS18]-alanine N-acetyltransferase n=1 Tax=Acetobacter suratthaniensis TaxID=1502841 RepID=A0ABS3LN02_9PROT|nr:ribosomal protein S18-alanine N-acetyltransferase [Acetobacter suratthaniensis]MBO1328744.1 ribosomal protein S18-alanine N-acetyltransferase [Acetobacter suratthaniensis]MCX2566805.1 ribosomal protein S18-alanine N-acetyltransferase [Acetobacter suratthaniensis]
MATTLQPVGVAHAAVLACLHAACFTPPEQWDEAAMASLLASPGAIALLACQNEAPAGFILFRCIADEAEVLTLCVLPASRRHGLARYLVEQAQQQAAQAGAERLFLEVSTHNEAASRLYEQAGFTRQGIRRRYYADGSDALVLASILPDTRHT